MLTTELIERFLAPVQGQALTEGTRYAQQARVSSFVGSSHSVTALVEGANGEYEVALWAEDGALAHRCECLSWREPCKHEVAAALALKGALDREPAKAVRKPGAKRDRRGPRAAALAERVLAAKREKLVVLRGPQPHALVESASGFRYRVRVRGGADGPHSCDCPDFEANRLHTCKHVERVRRDWSFYSHRLSGEDRAAISRPHVYLHFGEVIEPRLFGSAEKRLAPRLRARFDAKGLAHRALWSDEAGLLKWLRRLSEERGSVVDPGALDWLERRVERRPRLPTGDVVAGVLPKGARLYPYQRDGVGFLARTGRALLADEMGLGKTVQAILAA